MKNIIKISILSLFITAFLSAQEMVIKRLIVQVQLVKSDSSEFGHHEAAFNLYGYDVNSKEWYFHGPPDGQSYYVDSSGFVELYYDIQTKDLVTDVEATPDPLHLLIRDKSLLN